TTVVVLRSGPGVLGHRCSLCRHEVGEEVAEAGGDVHDAGTDRLEDFSRRCGAESDEEDQERHTAPGEDLLDHIGVPPWSLASIGLASGRSVPQAPWAESVITVSVPSGAVNPLGGNR